MSFTNRSCGFFFFSSFFKGDIMKTEIPIISLNYFRKGKIMKAEELKQRLLGGCHKVIEAEEELNNEPLLGQISFDELLAELRL